MISTGLAQWESGQIIKGTFRVFSPKIRLSVNGREYLTLFLEDGQHCLRAHLWRGSYQGELFYLTEIQRVFISGTLRLFNGQWIINIQHAKEVGSEVDDPLDLVPKRWYACPEHAKLLRKLLDSVTIEELRSFIKMVLSDDELMQHFLKLPASARHHHAYPGGLLAHSLECAAIVAATPGFSRAEMELGMVAAFIHDLGKIRTQGKGDWRFQQRMLLDHEIFTLELLAPYLKKLDHLWPEGGLVLRYLLSWKPKGKNMIPAITIAELVRCSDRVSAGRDRDKQASSQNYRSHFSINDGVPRFQVSKPSRILQAGNMA